MRYLECPKCGLSAYWNVQKQVCRNPSCTHSPGNIKDIKPVDVPPTVEIKMPNIFDKSWAWFNNKKTTIGMVLTLLGEGLAYAGLPWAKVLVEVGTGTGIVGIWHKIYKSLNNSTSGDRINWEEVVKYLIDFIKSFIKKGK